MKKNDLYSQASRKNLIFCVTMDQPETNKPNTAWKGWLIKFIIYLVVGFLCAFLYHQLKK